MRNIILADSCKIIKIEAELTKSKTILFLQVQDNIVFGRLISYIVPMTLIIFLPCFFGNELTIASQKLSQSLFHSSWYNQPKNFQTAMKVFMENTKKPLKVVACYGIFELSVETFLKIVNSAYSMYAFLKQL